jgi:hypothetical protein
MKTRKLIATSLVLALLMAAVPSAVAVPPLPSSFYGLAKVNGSNVPPGTVISAWINGVKYAEKTVKLEAGDTVYVGLDVPGDDPQIPGKEGGVPGDVIVFYIGQQEADPTAPWQGGMYARLDLTPKPGSEVLDHLIYLPILSKNY